MKTMLALSVSAVTLIGCSHPSQIQGIDGLAAQVPASSLGFVGVDAREKMPSDFIQTLEKKKDDPRLSGQLENYKRQLGHDPITALKAFEPTAWGVVVDANGKKDYAMVAGILVKDRKLAETCLAGTLKNETPTKAGTIDTYKNAGVSTCFKDPFLILSNKAEAIKVVTERQGPSLADDPGYKSAHSQMFQGQSLAFVYSAPPVAPKTFHYFAGGVGKQSPYRPVAFLSIDASAKNLLTPPPAASANPVPPAWNFYLALQLRYPLEAIQQAMPKALEEPGNGLKQVGTSPDQLNQAFEGDLALGLDLDQYFAKGVPNGPPNGLLVWGLRKPAEFEAFWKGFCRSNGFKTSSAKLGNYQVDRFAGMPFLMLARQGKQALLVLAQQPDDLLKSLQPKAQSADGTIFSLKYDLNNTRQQLAKSGLLGLSPDLAPLQAQMQSSSPEMWQGDMTVKVEKDGIRAEGNPVTMLIAGIVKMAILSEFLGK